MSRRSVRVTIVGSIPVPDSEVQEGDDYAYPPSEGSPADIERWDYEHHGLLSEVVSYFKTTEVTFEDVEE